MKTVSEHIRMHVLGRAAYPVKHKPDLDSLRETEWSARFERLCKKFNVYSRNRLVMGAFRYELLRQKKRNNIRFNYMSSAIERVKQWEKDGNDEHLVDIRNMCMLEFVDGVHPKKHFHATDNVSLHTKEKK